LTTVAEVGKAGVAAAAIEAALGGGWVVRIAGIVPHRVRSLPARRRTGLPADGNWMLTRDSPLVKDASTSGRL
jgi:hypothetical protein